METNSISHNHKAGGRPARQGHRLIASRQVNGTQRVPLPTIGRLVHTDRSTTGRQNERGGAGTVCSLAPPGGDRIVSTTWQVSRKRSRITDSRRAAEPIVCAI